MNIAGSLKRLLGANTGDEPAGEFVLTPRNILREMERVYAGCRSYRDSGVACMVKTDEGRREIVSIHFETAYVRPEQFIFGWGFEVKDRFSEPTCGAIWKNGDAFRSWFMGWDEPKIGERIWDVLPGFTGITSGSAGRVPYLLLPGEIHGPHFTKMKSPTITGSEMQDGHNCIIISGRGFGRQSETIWVDSRTYCLRKIVEFNSRAKREITTTYHPEFDCDIAASTFRFTPPTKCLADGEGF